ncbi:MAG: membrane protein insertase YidC [Candidatus Omnitrophota bacterium]|nr:MAG: membrane protein insertase YidC [Candidatus Omnitrophota bacterium]
MGKRTALALFLSLLVIMSYNYMMARKYPPAEQEVVPGQTKETIAPYRPAQPSGRMPESAVSPGIISSARDFVVETDLVRLVITESGARIKSCELKRYPEEKIDIRTVRKQLSAGRISQRERNKLELLLKRLEQKPQMAQLVSLPSTLDGDFSPAIIFPDDEEASSELNSALYRCPEEGLRLSNDNPSGQLEFIYTDSRGRKIKKVYSFSNSNYSIGLDISLRGWKKADFLLSCGPDVGMPRLQRGRMYGYQGPVSCFYNGRQAWTQTEKYSRSENNLFVRREHRQKGEILWAGLENKYFLTALIPLQPADAVIVEKNKAGEQKAALAVSGKDPGEPYNFRLYLGPKKRERLKEIGVSLEKSIDYGFFGTIARFMYRILLFFSGWTNNFGWGIILLCLVTKILFYPLTHHSFESMQKMQQQMKSIQPEMDELREKFKDNPQKLNKEIMGLYRRRGVNPLSSCQSGCLPLLLQMPVFFALYGILYNSIELRGAPFIGWITDLSAKDPYYVLPILMGISMFVQQKLTGMGTAGGAQQEQAKMMAYLMPVFLTWIFASLPSGVVLYWFTFNVATALQQLLIRKKQKAVSI